MDRIKFVIDEMERRSAKRGIMVGMARQQYASLRAERDEAVALLKMASDLNEEEAREREGAWSISSDFQGLIDVFLKKFLADPEQP